MGKKKQGPRSVKLLYFSVSLIALSSALLITETIPRYSYTPQANFVLPAHLYQGKLIDLDVTQHLDLTAYITSSNGVSTLTIAEKDRKVWSEKASLLELLPDEGTIKKVTILPGKEEGDEVILFLYKLSPGVELATLATTRGVVKNCGEIYRCMTLKESQIGFTDIRAEWETENSVLVTYVYPDGFASESVTLPERLAVTSPPV